MEAKNGAIAVHSFLLYKKKWVYSFIILCYSCRNENYVLIPIFSRSTRIIPFQGVVRFFVITYEFNRNIC